MMRNVKGVFNTSDRWPLKLTKVESNESKKMDKTPGTYYVLTRNADLIGDNVKLSQIMGKTRLIFCHSLSQFVIVGVIGH